MKKIDFESHYYVRSYIDAASEHTGVPHYDKKTGIMYHGNDGFLPIGAILSRLLELGEQRLKDMDEAGVDKCFLSISLGIGQFDAQTSQKLAMANHDELAQVIAKYPHRFGGYAVLPMHDTEFAVKELTRCHDELGYFGWNAFSNFGDKRLDDKACFPVLERAVQLNMPVYIHPSVPQIPDLHGYGPAMVTSGLGFAVDVTITLTRMIFAGIFDRLPTLKVIIGHLGECFPMILRRMDDSLRVQKITGKARNQKLPSEYFKENIRITSSGNFLAPAFQCAKDVFGIEHILFGTDYPMESLNENVDFIESLGLGEEDLDRVFWKNAEEYFHMKM